MTLIFLHYYCLRILQEKREKLMLNVAILEGYFYVKCLDLPTKIRHLFSLCPRKKKKKISWRDAEGKLLEFSSRATEIFRYPCDGLCHLFCERLGSITPWGECEEWKSETGNRSDSSNERKNINKYWKG